MSGTLLEAGSDTTSSTLYAFVQAMLLYPDVQRRAQTHIDKAIGSSRMPTMEDEADLPYVRCLMKETLSKRSYDTVLLHRSMADLFRPRVDANHDPRRSSSCDDIGRQV